MSTLSDRLAEARGRHAAPAAPTPPTAQPPAPASFPGSTGGPNGAAPSGLRPPPPAPPAPPAMPIQEEYRPPVAAAAPPQLTVAPAPVEAESWSEPEPSAPIMDAASTLSFAPAATPPTPAADKPLLSEHRQSRMGGNKDRLDELKADVHSQLLLELGPQLYEADMPPAELDAKVRACLAQVLSTSNHPLTQAERTRLIQDISDDILGYGPIEEHLRDDECSEVMVNGPRQIYIERKGKLILTETVFNDEAHLRRIIDKIVSKMGRRVDESSPLVDARLPDGSRVNAVIPPLAIDGSTLTIRKFSKDPLTVHDLIRFGSLDRASAAFLEACVRGRLNIIVSGGTGAGKTTTLNVLSSFIPADERIVTIEDAAELQLKQEHVVRLESRPANIEGKGAITIRDLVKNCLRMRPDRVVVGEVRDASALDMLQAMNTGHDGSICTLHSNGPRDTLSRLETMVLMAGMDLPIRAIREQAASAVDMVVHQARMKDGSRRITHITEVEGMEGDVITLQDIFLFESTGWTDEGKMVGSLKATGLRPKILQKLEDHNVHVDPTVFVPRGPR